MTLVPIIFFDIDDTLMTSSGASRMAMAKAFEHQFGETLDPGALKLSGRTDAGIFAEILARNGIYDDKSAFTEFQEIYLKYLTDFVSMTDNQLLPGALDILEFLEASGRARLGLITGNSRRGAINCLT